jgi:CRP/FNR family transcriptional regulator, anaerobic regulatory protein
MENSSVHRQLGYLGSELLEEIDRHGIIKTIPANTTLLKEGQYVKVIPLVLRGLIKVFTRYQEKELLLYYIQPNESCIMSFSASLKNESSKIVAITEEESDLLLLPVDKVSHWVKQYNSINQLFFQQYNLRYSELIDTINHLLFNKLDQRVYDYLKERAILGGINRFPIRHKQIATELGTAREVVTRVLKKLEAEDKIRQKDGHIEIVYTK